MFKSCGSVYVLYIKYKFIIDNFAFNACATCISYNLYVMCHHHITARAFSGTLLHKGSGMRVKGERERIFRGVQWQVYLCTPVKSIQQMVRNNGEETLWPEEMKWKETKEDRETEDSGWVLRNSCMEKMGQVASRTQESKVGS